MFTDRRAESDALEVAVGICDRTSFRTGNDDRASMTQDDGSEPRSRRPRKRSRTGAASRRVAVDLPGRYMLEDGSEIPCVCVDVSVGGVRLRAAHSGAWGSRVIAYIDGIGRLEGYIVRRAPGWFALETRSTARKGERVQERIAAILDSKPSRTADRRDERPRMARAVKVWLLHARRARARGAAHRRLARRARRC